MGQFREILFYYAQYSLLAAYMCKKISQLTRVIYLLNTKNDESNALIKSLYKTYDKEMETLRKNANETIKNFQKKLEKGKDTSLVDIKVKEIIKK